MLCPSCHSPIPDGAGEPMSCPVCFVLVYVPAAVDQVAPPDDVALVESTLDPRIPLPGAMAGVLGGSVAGLGAVEVLETRPARYLVRFANARREWVAAPALRGIGTSEPFPPDARVLVFVGPGEYVARTERREPGWHRVRAAGGMESWVEEHRLLFSFQPFGR
jgi:hypothetical protein